MKWLSKWRMSRVVGPTKHADFPRALVCLQTDMGCVRSNNEDSGRVVFADDGARGLLVVVADGIGGHVAGEVASRTAVESIAEEYTKAKGSPGEALEYAFHRANEKIWKLSTENRGMSGMGTTSTALALVGQQAWAAHVGDSRLYMVRDDAIYQLSEDHTAIMELVRHGVLSPEEAKRHEDRNVLTRAMGTKKELLLTLWRKPMNVRQGDTFVLCSDGLHDRVDDKEIKAVVCGAPPDQACRKLVQMAKERGGFDNITVAVVFEPLANSMASTLKETRAIEVEP